MVYPASGKGFDGIGQGMDSGWISHGVAILCLRPPGGHDVDLIDLRSLKLDDFHAQIMRRWPQVFAISMMSVNSTRHTLPGIIRKTFKAIDDRRSAPHHHAG